MEVRVLGPLEVRVGDDVIPVRAGRPRKLLAVLALRLGDRVTTDALVDLLWDGDAQRDRVNALRILVSYLRKVLAATDGTARIDTVEGGYRLVAPRNAVDAHRFDAAVASAARETEPRARLALLDGALSLWRGPAAPELADEEFARAELQRLTELRLAALERRVDCLLLLGRHVEAVADLQRLVAEHPLRERFHAQLMTALYRAARQAEALAVYERARRLLAEELGLDPGPELQAVAQAVLEQSPELGAPEPAPAEPAAGADGDGQGGPGRVPRPLDPLIGRGDEVERLSTLLSSRRLVTLTGPGGAGKTRLAAELAACLPATAWWVDLSAAENADSVLAAVARGTDATARGGEARAALVSQLATREGLLVLDTCERVRAPVRALVELILRSCPGVRVLATSRQPLGAATELAWPVPPLSLPDPDADSPEEIGAAAAVQLFLERAGNRRPGLELTADNCVDVARICLLLDGLPLAIELAAAHAGMLEPRTMVRVLDDRLRLLVDETKDERQHTLRATIAWSHELLSEDEAAFFARLSVFAGAFPMQAAEAVAGTGLQRDGLELLLALAQQSLVVAAGGDRFRLLDTVRAFAAERLADRGDDEAQTRRRHAHWYADVLSETASPGRRRTQLEAWRGDLRDALPDLRRALEWCFTGGDDELGARLLSVLWWLWPREGVFEEAAAWFPRAKALVPPGSGLQADLLASSGTHAVSRGDLETAVRECATAVELYDRMGHRRSGAHALMGLGVAYWGLGDYERAAAAHDRAVGAFAEMNDLWGVGICLALRARTAIDAGEPDVVARLEAAEAAAVRSGDDHALGVVLMQRGRADIAAGDAAAAERHALESLRRNQQHGHHEGVLGSLHVLGFVRVSQGDVDGAGAHFTRALRSAVSMQHAGATAESLDGLGLVAARRGRPEDAAALFAAAEDLRARWHIRRTPLTARLVERARAELTDAVAPDDLGRAERRGLGLELPDLLELAVRTA
jgi:predicted ATPase/DNA-binding SARP family transcriptional activator